MKRIIKSAIMAVFFILVACMGCAWFVTTGEFFAGVTMIAGVFGVLVSIITSIENTRFADKLASMFDEL